MLHHFPDGDFTLQDAQGVYEALISGLHNFDGNVANAAMAKAYCPLGGAAVFQFFPFYSDKARALPTRRRLVCPLLLVLPNARGRDSRAACMRSQP